MKNQKLVPHAMSGVFVFVLLGLFAVFSVVTVLLSASAYRSIADRADSDGTTRLSSAYLRSMLRARDEAGTVQVADEDGVRAVVLNTRYDSDEYLTRIYVYDGMLRELFTEAEMPFEPENGETVCPAEDMEAELDGELLRVRVLTEGEWHEVDYALHGAAERGAA